MGITGEEIGGIVDKVLGVNLLAAVIAKIKHD